MLIAYEGPAGRGFLGIKVKYHEDLTGKLASDPTGRYVTLARQHGVFRVNMWGPETLRRPMTCRLRPGRAPA